MIAKISKILRLRLGQLLILEIETHKQLLIFKVRYFSSIFEI